MKIAYDEKKGIYYILLEARRIEAKYGISCYAKYGTLCKFRKGIYRGSHEFKTLQEANTHLDKITDNDMFIGNKKHSELEIINV